MDRILAVIPVHNRRDTTLRFLQGLGAVKITGFHLDVLVIDDGSTDGTSEEIARRFPQVLVLQGAGNLWWGGALNVGFKYALDHEYNYIYTLNDDMVLRDDTLDELFKAACAMPDTVCHSVVVDENGRVVGAGYVFSRLLHKVKSLHRNEDYSSLNDDYLLCETFSTQSSLIPVAVLRHGLFVDENRFPHNYSDLEYFDRVRLNGFKLAVIRSSVVQAGESSSNYHLFILGKSVSEVLGSFRGVKYAHNFHTQWNLAFVRTGPALGSVRFIFGMLPYLFWLMLRILLPRKVLASLLVYCNRCVPSRLPEVSMGAGAQCSKVKKLLFVGDGGRSPCLDRLLGLEGITVEYRVRSTLARLSAPKRHFYYLSLAASAIRARRDHDFILIWQQYVGLYYCLLSLLFPFHRRPVLVYFVIFKRAGHSAVNRVKRFLMLAMIHSRHIARVFFMSRSDELYPLAAESKRAVLSQFYLLSDYIEKRVGENGTAGEYFFSGGASNRDYGELKRLALRMPAEEFKIACFPQTAATLLPLPANLQVLTDAWDEYFERLIFESKAVILPLVDPNVMSGQIVCLRAMQSGKPVFIKENNFIFDWIKDVGELDFIIAYRDLDDLHSRLQEMTDDDLAVRGANARKYFFDHFSEEALYGRVADEIVMLSGRTPKRRSLEQGLEC